MARCSLCAKTLKPTTTTQAVKVGRVSVTVTGVPALRCTGCREVFTDYHDLKRAELRVAELVILSGYANGDSFRFLRHTLGMRANNLARFMGTTPETISRWERGTRPVDVMTWIVLSLLVVGQISHDEMRRDDIRRGRDPDARKLLEVVANPKALPTRIRLAS